MTYDFRAIPEILWAVFIAMVVYIAQTLVFFNPSEILDWRTWAISLLAGCIRAAASVVIAILTKPSKITVT